VSPAMSTALLVARRVGIVITLVVILAQPGFGTRAVSTQSADIEVLVVVDRTRSMAALDYQDGPRIYGVQRDLADLADALPGARFALLTFGSEVTLELPFTTDTTTFRTGVETMRLEGPFDGSGSLVDRPLDSMREILERAEEQHPERPRVVVFVSDGENTTDEEQRSFDELEELVDGGVVLGYGTDDGAKMPEADDLSTDDGFVYDQDSGEDAISRIDEDNLEDIADELGIDYQHRTEPGGMRAIADDFEASYAFDNRDDAPAKHDLTWLFGLILLALVLIELRSWWQAVWTSHTTLLPSRTLRQAQGPRGAP
jgi:Ca-activated chloride channel family protein